MRNSVINAVEEQAKLLEKQGRRRHTLDHARGSKVPLHCNFESLLPCHLHKDTSLCFLVVLVLRVGRLTAGVLGGQPKQRSWSPAGLPGTHGTQSDGPSHAGRSPFVRSAAWGNAGIWGASSCACPAPPCCMAPAPV